MHYDLDDMPDELAARVRAATGEPDHLWIRRTQEWVIEAVSGDRATVMRLALSESGSVAETTSSFVLGAIHAVDPGADATVTIRDRQQLVTLPISYEFAQVLGQSH